ncbi:MAG: serine/threonine-protein kinase [Myxococcota bacterium]
MGSRSHFSDPESRAFLQRRVAAFGGVGAIIGLVATLFRLLISARFSDVGDELRSPDFLLQCLGVVPSAAMWLICRRGALGVRTIEIVETVGILLTAGLYIAMGSHIPAEVGADTITAFILSFILFARAVYVPSTVRRTILIGVAMGAPLVVTMYFHYLNSDYDWKDLGWGEVPESKEVVAAVSASVTTMWWTLVIGLASLATRVIHGLRQEVRDIKSLGQYTLERKLGEGGMGVVFQATHGMLKRPTAIKLMRQERVSLDAQARFRREVQLTAKLRHPHTVRIHDYGKTPDGVFYYAMELLEGATVREIVEAAGSQPPARVAHILRDAALALNEAHSIGLIHRDIKPGNIMLAEQGGELDVTKVLDFGLVKSIGTEATDRTDANVVMGTPQYLSPEAIQDPVKVCPESDLYALGAVGYYLLTGGHVFDGETVMEVCLKHLQSTPVPPSELCSEPIPPELEAVIMHCLEKSPADRPSSGRAIAGVLEHAPIPRWTREDAEAWWQRFGPLLESGGPEERVSVTDKTVAVDLSVR